jgi:preprotein translocase subunit SecG
MSTLFTILAVLALVGSVLITLIVLLQNSKGGGLASNFTAGNQTFGVRQTTDILEKITWGLAAFILVVSIVTSLSMGRGTSTIDITEKIELETPAPEFPAQLPATENPAN